MNMIYKPDEFFVLWVYRFLWFLMESMIEFPIQTSTWRILFLRWSFDCVILYMCDQEAAFYIFMFIYVFIVFWVSLIWFLQLISERVVNLRRNETVQCVMGCILGSPVLVGIRWACLFYYKICNLGSWGWVYFLEYASVFRWFFHHKLGFLICVRSHFYTVWLSCFILFL